MDKLKVINVYFEEPDTKKYPFRNGLSFELEDGTILYQHVSEQQCLEPFDKVKDEKRT